MWRARAQHGGSRKKADYLLRYTRDKAIALVEAKADYTQPGDGLGPAKGYADVLGLKFAYSTNGTGIVEFDFLTGTERNVDAFPSPDELWSRLKTAEGITPEQERQVLTPGYHAPGRPLRYYQEVAVNCTAQAMVQGIRADSLQSRSFCSKVALTAVGLGVRALPRAPRDPPEGAGSPLSRSPGTLAREFTRSALMAVAGLAVELLSGSVISRLLAAVASWHRRSRPLDKQNEVAQSAQW